MDINTIKHGLMDPHVTVLEVHNIAMHPIFSHFTALLITVPIWQPLFYRTSVRVTTSQLRKMFCFDNGNGDQLLLIRKTCDNSEP